jgi:hypothetical protein
MVEMVEGVLTVAVVVQPPYLCGGRGGRRTRIHERWARTRGAWRPNSPEAHRLLAAAALGSGLGLPTRR